MSSALRGRPRAIGAAPARLLAAAAACLMLAAVVYALALGTDALLRVDREMRFPQIVGDWRLRDQASWVFSVASLALFVAGGAAVAGAALLRGGVRRAAVVVGVIGAGPLAAWALGAALATTDPVGGEALRSSQGAFPSGHATVALSLGLGLVVALPPRRRLAGGVAAVVVASAIGIGVIALGWHYPSDVVGAFLVSLAGAAVVLAAACPRSPARPRTGGLAGLSAAAAAACAVLGALALWALPDEAPGAFVDAHGAFIVFAAAACVLALACVAALLALMGAGSGADT